MIHLSERSNTCRLMGILRISEFFKVWFPWGLFPYFHHDGHIVGRGSLGGDFHVGRLYLSISVFQYNDSMARFGVPFFLA